MMEMPDYKNTRLFYVLYHDWHYVSQIIFISRELMHLSSNKPISPSEYTCPETCLKVSQLWREITPKTRIIWFDIWRSLRSSCMYNLLAFRKYMSLLWWNFLNCLSSVGKCVKLTRRAVSYTERHLRMLAKLGLRSTDLWLNTNKHSRFPEIRFNFIQE